MRFSRFLLLLLAADIAPAAEPSPAEISALERRIAVAPASERVALFIELADRLEAVDPVRAVEAAEAARSAAVSPREKLLAVAALTGLRRQQTKYPEAMDLAQEGLEGAIKLGDDRLRARFLYLLARTAWSLADYPASIARFHEAILLGEQSGDLALLSDAHIGIVTIYTELKDYTQSQSHLDQAKEYAERIADSRRLGDYYKVLGNHLGNRGDQAGSRTAHLRSLEIHERAGNERGVADALQNVGNSIELAGDFAGARERYTRAIGIYERFGLKRHLANATRLLGRVLAKERRFDEGFAQLERSRALATEFAGAITLANAYRELAVAHEAAGNLGSALDFQRKLQSANDQIFTEKSQQQVLLLNAQFKAERRRLEIDLLRREQSLNAAELRAREAELQRARTVRWALAGAAGTIALALGSILLAQRSRLRAERLQSGETRRARAAAEEANTLKSQLLGIASHDLKAPLRSMLVRAEQLAPELAGSPSGTAALAQLRSEGERMFAIVHDLLEVSTIESGELQLNFAPVDLAAVTKEVVANLQAPAKLKSLALKSNLPPTPVWVRGDDKRLHQIVTHLIDNAVKHTPPGKNISVQVTTTGSDASLSVRDEGPGIYAADLGRVFQPPQTMSSVPNGAEPSSGLSLYLCREIIARHGGRIDVDSHPWNGATFTVVLPSRAARSSTEALAALERNSPN